MPTPRQMRKFVNQIVNQKIEEYPTTATIAEVNGNTCDVRLPGRSTHHKNCHIIGDPNSLFAGLHVNLLWDNYNGTKRPIVLAPGGGGVSGENRMVISTTSGTSTDVDDVTIENSPQGIRVKIGSITQEHLSFIPALIDHEHAIGEIMPGWNITDDGILYSGQVSINPLGTITWGRDPDIVKIGVEDGTYRIFAGSSVGSAAPFSVSKAGALVSTSAVIAGWTINSTEIKKTGIILDSANDTIYVGESSPRIVIDGVEKVIKSSDFTAGSSGFGIQALDGYAEFNNVKIRGSLRASVFEYGDIQATAGTLMVSRSAAKLEDDFTSPASVGNNVNIDVTNDNEGTPLFAITQDEIATFTLGSGGTGYLEEDILTISGGTGGQVVVKAISAGVITKIVPRKRGYGYSAGTKATTGGAGTGATVTITIKDEGDILQIKTLQPTGVAESWFEVQSKLDLGNYTRHNCKLLFGDTSTTYEKGTGIASLGQNTTGIIYLSADNAVGYSANMTFTQWWRNAVGTVSVVANGSGYQIGDLLYLTDANSLTPCIVEVTAVNGSNGVTAVTIVDRGSDYSTGTKATWEKTGSTGCTISIDTLVNPWNSQTTFGRLGNIRGAYGASGTEDGYGFGFGDYSSGNYLSYNAEVENGFIFSSGEGLMRITSTGLQIEMDDDYTDPAEIIWLHKGTTTPGWTMAGQQFEVLGTYSQTFSIVSSSGVDAFDYSAITLSASGDGTAGEDSSVTLHAVNTASGSRNAYMKIASNNANTWGLLQADKWTMTPGGGTNTLLHLDGMTQITGAVTPADGEGIEIAFWPASNYGRVLAYDRDASAYRTLRLEGDAIQFYESNSARFKIDGGTLQKYIDGGWEVTEQVVFDRNTALSGWTGAGRSSSTGTWTEADLNIPEGAKAVYLRIAARDSGAWPKDIYFAVGRDGSTFDIAAYPPGASGGVELFDGETGWAQFSGGTVNWKVVASGSGTMDVWVWVLGYAM